MTAVRLGWIAASAGAIAIMFLSVSSRAHEALTHDQGHQDSVVTAQKRSGSAQISRVTVSAIASDTLATQGIHDIVQAV